MSTDILNNKSSNIKQKSVGIITIQNIMNYGACLQSFALWYKIKSLGYNCEIINLLTPSHKGFEKSKKFHTYEKKISFLKKTYRIGKQFLKKTKEKYLFWEEKEAIRKKHDNFINFNKQIDFSKEYKNSDALYKDPPTYDIYVTGSDQVWNPTLGFELEAYFLTFAVPNAKKIAYAPSIARNDLPPQFTDKYKKWLMSYDALSIREQSGQTIIRDIIGKQIQVVLDPTFLLSNQEWKSQMSQIFCPSKYILCFTLSDKNLIDYSINLSKESNLPLLIISTYINYKVDNAIVILDAGPAELISYINSAELVITDSFHGVAMSVQLAKNFFAYIKKNKTGIPDISDRIRTLLETFNLNDHIISNLSHKYSYFNNNRYDRTELNKLIDKARMKSQNFLIESLAL